MADSELFIITKSGATVLVSDDNNTNVNVNFLPDVISNNANGNAITLFTALGV